MKDAISIEDPLSDIVNKLDDKVDNLKDKVSRAEQDLSLQLPPIGSKSYPQENSNFFPENTKKAPAKTFRENTSDFFPESTDIPGFDEYE